MSKKLNPLFLRKFKTLTEAAAAVRRSYEDPQEAAQMLRPEYREGYLRVVEQLFANPLEDKGNR